MLISQMHTLNAAILFIQHGRWYMYMLASGVHYTEEYCKDVASRPVVLYFPQRSCVILCIVDMVNTSPCHNHSLFNNDKVDFHHLYISCICSG